MSVSDLVTADPIRLGSILFTLVEPHPGHEVAYNRWYERDHFYAGCMIGPYNFAGARFVATRELKALRPPSELVPDPSTGSYLAIYFVLDGHHDEWNRWALKQVRALHAARRMFDERDHVHTLLYRYEFGVLRDGDGVPAELALDRRFPGLVAVIGEASGDRAELLAWYRAGRLPRVLEGSAAAMCLTFTPLPIEVDVPGVPRSPDADRRFLQLWFLESEAWRDTLDRLDRERARVLFASPFIPTIPGTDAYTDLL